MVRTLNLTDAARLAATVQNVGGVATMIDMEKLSNGGQCFSAEEVKSLKEEGTEVDLDNLLVSVPSSLKEAISVYEIVKKKSVPLLISRSPQDFDFHSADDTSKHASATTQAAHTPGPWHWENGPPRVGEHYENDSGEYLSILGPRSKGAAHVTVGVDHNQGGDMEANARLISAAPDLLESLQRLVRQVEKSNAVDDHGHELKKLKALWDARDVIAVATGEKR